MLILASLALAQSPPPADRPILLPVRGIGLSVGEVVVVDTMLRQKLGEVGGGIYPVEATQQLVTAVGVDADAMTACRRVACIEVVSVEAVRAGGQIFVNVIDRDGQGNVRGAWGTATPTLDGLTPLIEPLARAIVTGATTDARITRTVAPPTAAAPSAAPPPAPTAPAPVAAAPAAAPEAPTSPISASPEPRDTKYVGVLFGLSVAPSLPIDPAFVVAFDLRLDRQHWFFEVEAGGSLAVTAYGAYFDLFGRAGASAYVFRNDVAGVYLGGVAGPELAVDDTGLVLGVGLHAQAGAAFVPNASFHPFVQAKGGVILGNNTFSSDSGIVQFPRIVLEGGIGF